MKKDVRFDSLGYYKMLNVSSNATDDELRQKYYELVKIWHPDHNTSPEAIEMFQKISLAYEILKDNKSRLKYKMLSMIYDNKNFPNMNALAILRNLHGQEDVNMRAFHLIEVTGKGLGHSIIDKIYYCSSNEALRTIKQITKHNWVYGFWGISAFFVNIYAIVKNIISLKAYKENLALFIHNSIAYADAKQYSEALTSLQLAKKYASLDEIKLIDEYSKNFIGSSPLQIKGWNYKKLLQAQLMYPLLFLVSIIAVFSIIYLKSISKTDNNDLQIKQIVTFANGQKTFSDVSVAKFFDIPVDVYDKELLYHTKYETKAMHGADDSFDVYKTVESGLTVRITGYTADKKWFRVLFDNGEMAFIKVNDLEQGIGKEIPLWSKIYKEK